MRPPARESAAGGRGRTESVGGHIPATHPARTATIRTR